MGKQPELPNEDEIEEGPVAPEPTPPVLSQDSAMEAEALDE